MNAAWIIPAAVSILVCIGFAILRSVVPKKADGKKLDELAAIPQHWNCRCTLQPITQPELLSRDDVLELAGGVKWDKATALDVIDDIDRALSEYETLLPKGWQPWEGGKCPVPFGTNVVVMHRDGNIVDIGNAYHLPWHHENICADILAYRIAD